MSYLSSESKWSTLEKVGFRFSFIYVLLFIVFKNNGAYPFWSVLMSKPTKWLQSFIPWIGKTILNLPKDIVTFTNGSGDTTYDYVSILLFFMLAIFGAIIWSLADRERLHYKKLYYWITVAIRFYVAFMLINYGLVKVIKLQFPSPSFYRLLEPYGESSPMGLAWAFLGFSKGYNLFMGLAELLAGLLLFRRTMTAGAIITLMTASNVMAVNYFYDVPVKILSTHLVLMALFLLAHDIKKLFLFFFTNNAVKLVTIKQPIYKNNWFKPSALIVKYVLIGFVLIYGGIGVLNSVSVYGDLAKKPENYGLYEITHFEKNSKTIPADENNESRWKYIMIEREGSLQIQKMDRSKLFFKTEIDSLTSSLKLTSYKDSTDSFKLKLKNTEPTFSLETLYKGDTIKAYGNTIKKEDFLLMNRGFNWVNEYPFNR
jgi:hypothetical protein